MKVYHGNGKTKYGTGVQIDLTGNEVAIAIAAYLVAHNVHVSGARTITVNGELIENGGVYVDPSGFVIHNGEKLSGRGESNKLCTSCNGRGEGHVTGLGMYKCSHCDGTGRMMR